MQINVEKYSKKKIIKKTTSTISDFLGGMS